MSQKNCHGIADISQSLHRMWVAEKSVNRLQRKIALVTLLALVSFFSTRPMAVPTIRNKINSIMYCKKDMRAKRTIAIENEIM